VAENPILRALERLGIRFDGQFQFKFGSGVTPKTSGALMVTVPSIVAAAIWMPEGPSKLIVLVGLMALVAYFLLGTWIHTTINPQSPLEGSHLVAYHEATLAAAAKGLPPQQPTPAIENPEYKVIEDQSGGQRG